MPLTYSIAYGLIAGIGCYLIMHVTFWILSFVGIKKPVFTDPNEVFQEPEDVVVVLDDVKIGQGEDIEDAALSEQYKATDEEEGASWSKADDVNNEQEEASA